MSFPALTFCDLVLTPTSSGDKAVFPRICTKNLMSSGQFLRLPTPIQEQPATDLLLEAGLLGGQCFLLGVASTFPPRAQG